MARFSSCRAPLFTGSKPEVVMGSKVSSKMAAPTARVIQVTLLPILKLLLTSVCSAQINTVS